MRKYQRDFVVNAAAFVCFVALAATGLVMRFRLPKGSGESLSLWGLGRHDWGGVHFWIAAAMVAVIVLHLVFNWSWIAAVVRGRPRTAGIGPRVGAGLIAVAVLALAAGILVLSPVRETGEPAEQEGERVRAVAPVVPAADTARCAPAPAAELHGTMSLEEVARVSGVPAEHFVRQLRLPAGVSRTRPVRELRDEHGFTMDDVRRVAAEYRRGC